MNREEDDGNQSSNKSAAGDNNNSIDNESISDTSKDIKKGMDRYEAKIKSGEAPAGDATSSDE
jgi:hypothetical protein